MAFVGYAVTGLRWHELLDLKMPQIKRDLRAIIQGNSSRTKRTYITFYNDEFEEHLRQWERIKKPSDRLFPIRGSHKSVLFMMAQQKTGLRITPQTLGFWLANEMAAWEYRTG